MSGAAQGPGLWNAGGRAGAQQRNHDMANRRAHFDGMQGMHLQWLPSGCTDMPFEKSRAKKEPDADGVVKDSEGGGGEWRGRSLGSTQAWS